MIMSEDNIFFLRKTTNLHIPNNAEIESTVHEVLQGLFFNDDSDDGRHGFRRSSESPTACAEFKTSFKSTHRKINPSLITLTHHPIIINPVPLTARYPTISII